MKHRLFLLAAAIFLAFSANAQHHTEYGTVTVKQTDKRSYSGGLTLTKYRITRPPYKGNENPIINPYIDFTIWYPSGKSKVAHAIASNLGGLIHEDVAPSRISHFKRKIYNFIDIAGEGVSLEVFYKPIYANKSCITMTSEITYSAPNHVSYEKDASTFLLSTGKRLTSDMLPPLCKLMDYVRPALRKHFATTDDSIYAPFFNCATANYSAYVNGSDLCLLFCSMPNNNSGQPVARIPYKKIAHLLSPQVKAYFK